MNERDKLIELICQITQDGCECYCNHPYCSGCKDLADYLLANGVIVPPCKVGDIVWRIEDVWHLDDRETWTYHYEKEVLEFMVRSISISCNSKGVWTKKIRICQVIDGKTIDRQRNIEFDEIGKTVFLSRSREEAEKALEGVE
jgi:hypothetical protein